MKALRFISNKLWACVREWEEEDSYNGGMIPKAKVYADSVPQIWGDEWSLTDIRRRYSSADFTDIELVPVTVAVQQYPPRHPEIVAENDYTTDMQTGEKVYLPAYQKDKK